MQIQSEWVARPGIEAAGDPHAIVGLIAANPVGPAGQAVDRVVAADFVDRQLHLLAVEFVASVGKSVRPRQQRLAAATVGHAVDLVTVEHGLTIDDVFAQAAAHFDHHGALAAMADFKLAA